MLHCLCHVGCERKSRIVQYIDLILGIYDVWLLFWCWQKQKKVLKDRKSEAIGQQCLLHDMPGETEAPFLTASVGHDNGAYCSTMMAEFFVFI